MDLPKVPPLKSKPMIIVGSIGAVVVGYAWWHNRQAAATAAATDTTDPNATTDGYVTDASAGDPGLDTATLASTTPSVNDVLAGNAAPTDNGQWSQLAVQELSNTGGWDAGTVASALGAYLARQPLTQTQIEIVRTALAMAGPPPVGSYAVIPIVGTQPPPPTPTPTPKPPVSGKPVPGPKPPVPVQQVPAHDSATISFTARSLSALVAKYNKNHHTHHTVDEVWQFNLKYRDPATQKILKARGENRTYIGSTFWIPR